MSVRELVPWGRLVAELPAAGRHLTACWDESSVVLYQAYPAPLAEVALREGRLGGVGWRNDRTSKLRTSFTDLMRRSDAGRGEGREVVLGVHIRREAFDAMLRQAVHAVFPGGVYPNKQSWRLATRHAQVLLDWSGVPGPDGVLLARQAARLGLRDHALRHLVANAIGVEDLTGVARALRDGSPTALVPTEKPYPVEDDALLGRLTFVPEA